VIPFKMQSRVDLMTRQAVQQLADAGCFEVWMGAESGSQEILDAMQKGTKVRHILEASDNLGLVGIRRCLFLQFGYPGENWEDIQKTIALVRDAQPDDIGVSVSYPLPGTPFYRSVVDQLGPKTNWEDSDDLAMIFKGAYTSEFYQTLHDALHCEVELSRRIRQSPVDGLDSGEPAGKLSFETIQQARRHLQELWTNVVDREKSCRNTNPTFAGVNTEWTCS
jgi:anaerobic magnesium-protoporphyrin IX monomethyl ester cyclase